MTKQTKMNYDFLLYFRPIKNFLYVLVGMILGVWIVTDFELGRVDIIILVFAGIIFIWEFICYIFFLMEEIQKSKKRRIK